MGDGYLRRPLFAKPINRRGANLFNYLFGGPVKA